MPLDPKAWKLAQDRLRGPQPSTANAERDEATRIIRERNGRASQLGSVVNTPGQILNAMNVVNRLVDSLGVSVNSQKGRLSKTLVSQFAAFWNEWKAFYNANNGLWARLWQGTYEQVLAYQSRAAEWQQRLAKGGATVTPDVPTSDKPPTTATDVVMYVSIGVVAVVGLVLVTRLARSVSLGRAQLADAEKEAIQIAGAKKRR